MATVFRRNVTVSFYVVEPEDPWKASWDGDFPREEVLAKIANLDLASGEFHVQTGLFGNELFCTVHDGPLPLVGAYTKDKLNAVLTEYKGSIEEIAMREGEGVIDGTYAAFFPNSVVGVVRSSVKAPGSGGLAGWLSLFGGHPCVMPALPKADALAGLQRPAEEIIDVTFRAKKRLVPRIKAVRADVAGIIESAAGVGGSTKVGFTLATETKKERPAWWPSVRAAINDLAAAELLADFDAASVKVSGRHSINLRDAYVSDKRQIELQKGKRLGPAHAAEALAGAYGELEASVIVPSVEAWRKSRGARRRPPDNGASGTGGPGVG